MERMLQLENTYKNNVSDGEQYELMNIQLFAIN